MSIFNSTTSALLIFMFDNWLKVYLDKPLQKHLQEKKIRKVKETTL